MGNGRREEWATETSAALAIQITQTQLRPLIESSKSDNHSDQTQLWSGHSKSLNKIKCAPPAAWQRQSFGGKMVVAFDFSTGPQRAGLKATSYLATVVRWNKFSWILVVKHSQESWM